MFYTCGTHIYQVRIMECDDLPIFIFGVQTLLITSTSFAWSLIPRDILADLRDNLFEHKINYKFRPLCLITSTLFAWSLIPRHISADLRDDLCEHKTIFTTVIQFNLFKVNYYCDFNYKHCNLKNIINNIIVFILHQY